MRVDRHGLATEDHPAVERHRLARGQPEPAEQRSRRALRVLPGDGRLAHPAGRRVRRVDVPRRAVRRQHGLVGVLAQQLELRLRHGLRAGRRCGWSRTTVVARSPRRAPTRMARPSGRSVRWSRTVGGRVGGVPVGRRIAGRAPRGPSAGARTGMSGPTAASISCGDAVDHAGTARASGGDVGRGSRPAPRDTTPPRNGRRCPAGGPVVADEPGSASRRRGRWSPARGRGRSRPAPVMAKRRQRRRRSGSRAGPGTRSDARAGDRLPQGRPTNASSGTSSSSSHRRSAPTSRPLPATYHTSGVTRWPLSLSRQAMLGHHCDPGRPGCPDRALLLPPPRVHSIHGPAAGD